MIYSIVMYAQMLRSSLATNKLLQQNSLWTASGTARMLSTRMYQQTSLWSLKAKNGYDLQISTEYLLCIQVLQVLRSLRDMSKDSWLSRSPRSYGGCGRRWYSCSWYAMLHATIFYSFPATMWLSIFFYCQGRFCHWEMVRTCFRKNNMPFSKQVRECQGNRLAKPPQWTVLSWTPLCYFTISCILGKETYQQWGNGNHLLCSLCLILLYHHQHISYQRKRTTAVVNRIHLQACIDTLILISLMTSRPAVLHASPFIVLARAISLAVHFPSARGYGGSIEGGYFWASTKSQMNRFHPGCQVRLYPTRVTPCIWVLYGFLTHISWLSPSPPKKKTSRQNAAAFAGTCLSFTTTVS